jgi:methionyl-tRNA formyltransferase
MMKVAALGRTHWLYDSIRACVASGHQIVLIGTNPSQPEYSVTERDFKTFAEQLRCPFICDKKINRPEYVQMIKESEAEVAISVNWMTIIERNIVELFKYGMINAHVGDLPRFKGNACPNWAILAGEERIVLTLHRMDETLDGGPILLQREFPLSCSTYIGDIYRFMSENIPPMFVEVLQGLAEGTMLPRNQSTEAAGSLRCFPRLPGDGQVDWNRSAVDLSRLVRASAEPFGGAYSFIGTDRIVFWRAHPETLPYRYLGVPGQVAEIRPSEGSVAVLTGEGVLVLEEIEAADGRRGPASSLIQSTRIRFTLDVVQMLTQLNERITQLEKKFQEISGKPEKLTPGKI